MNQQGVVQQPIVVKQSRAVARQPRDTGAERSTWTNALFVLPFLVAYGALLVYPLFKGFAMSLNDYDLLGGDIVWVGWQNFTQLWADPIFLGAVRNTLLFVLITTPIMVALGVVLALALNTRTSASGVLRCVFFGSSVLSVTVVTLVWRMVLLPQNGLLANILTSLHLPPMAVLVNRDLALPAIAVVTVWWAIGLPMMLFLAALQQIPGDIYEAARLDNAGWWRTLWSITLPSIRRTVVLVAIVEVILQFQLFGQAQLLTGGGPDNSTRPIVQFIYESGFRDWRLGYAAAGSQVLFAFMLAAAAAQFWFSRRRGMEA